MDHMLMLLLLLCSSGIQAEKKHISAEPGDLRLVGGANRCAGRLELKQQGQWKPVDALNYEWKLPSSAEVCRELGCGSVVATQWKDVSFDLVWEIRPSCLQTASTFRECVDTSPKYSSDNLAITCSESVRLVNGNSLCSGRVEVKSDQSWSSVCEADFDQQDAEVVCRELGCGAPSVLQGALYGEVEAPMWTKEFQCKGSESSLLDCGSSGSARNTCSPGKAVGLTCSEPHDIRLVGGASRCNGTLEVKHLGDWKPVDVSHVQWNLKTAGAVCRELDCGSAVSAVRRQESSYRPAWMIIASCLQSGSALRECLKLQLQDTRNSLDITCSESVRLVNGNSLCSGRVEVKSDQSWSSVCEADFDQQDAEVVCRELGCGPPSVLQGALYGEAEAPMWTKEYQCEGNESSLLDCGSSGSARNTCSPGKAVGLTCSEPDVVRLVGEASRCSGRLEVKHLGEWEPVLFTGLEQSMQEAAAVCRDLNCGGVVSAKQASEMLYIPVSEVRLSCLQSGSRLRECIEIRTAAAYARLEITCSESVRLVNGNSLCSGRVEVKSDQSWSSVCEAEFDQQDAEVVCRELGCGAPSVLQGALYGEVEAPMWTKEFQCEGNESSLQDCGSSGSARNTCSSGKAVGLTCSEPVRLVGGGSRCNGTLEMKHLGEWRPVAMQSELNLKTAAAMCRELDCGSAVSAERRRGSLLRSVWEIGYFCYQSGSSLKECLEKPSHSTDTFDITCSESVRLVNGNSLCSGRVEVKSDQSWSSVCEADFDQQDAEVVCRELGCGPPSVLQGALYGEAEAPMWTKEFQCEGNESSLLDCGSSGSARNTCSPGKAVGLTCSEPDDIRLVGGDSRCNGRLEMKHLGVWRPVDELGFDLNLKSTTAVCRQLGCGSAVSAERRIDPLHEYKWYLSSSCFLSGSTLRECVYSPHLETRYNLEITCSGQQGAEASTEP
ncbi:scavenger receptor cysteine-rich type 1 protein M160-like [Myripristis murdjan]|uniref:scavenger receptor cysteine-rich type 1 protein M160-like n=1 Tax=Myripristis murdjan TaxID=586833 RepID=UPI001175EF99|nr:scavenger receptor cysteine-rich type 1 protein M160-like [Myripristis murdjan]